MSRQRKAFTAIGLGVLLFVIYNVNGREIESADSKPLGFTAREIVQRGTLRLDRAIEERPALAQRGEFPRDRRGHVRSGRPVLPAIIAAGPGVLLRSTGWVDLDAPLGVNLIAKVTASLLTAAAVALVFLSLLRICSVRLALAAAIALGLGTNYWAIVSQTLWQHETVAFGLALALWAWLRPPASIRLGHLVIGGLGLGLAGASRPQVAPLVAVLLLSIAVRRRWLALVPIAVVCAFAIASVVTNQRWFGHPLGGLYHLQALNPSVHLVSTAFSPTPWIGGAGLLVSPSRGLFAFSPIVLTVFAGLGATWRDRSDVGLRWLALATVVQWLVYAWFSVWWGGHTYGPRFMLDVLVPAAPIGALGAERLASRRWGQPLLVGALAVSIAVAGAGAFVYPNESWNSEPTEIDHDHDRLWDVADAQIWRAFRAGQSPANYDLFEYFPVRR